MNKNELIKAIAKKTGKNSNDIKDVLEALESTVTETLKKGETIKVIGFGIASVKHTNARASRNPKTGEPVQAKARTLPVFKFSPAVTDAMEENNG